MHTAWLYIHGFNSSPASFKARVLKQALNTRAPSIKFLAPALPHSPQAATQMLDDLVNANPAAMLLGSSLGGYYATRLAERYNMRAVLINPAVRPYELLGNHTGSQKNLYTGEEYEFTPGHVEELRALEIDLITPEHYLLMVETGDEVLDYRLAIERYRGARQCVIEGGDHGFSDFEQYLDLVFEFARL